MATANKKSIPHVMDMTQGNPAKLMLTFAIPLFIGNIFQQIYSMVDTMVAGYTLGDSAIAAIGAIQPDCQLCHWLEQRLRHCGDPAFRRP